MMGEERGGVMGGLSLTPCLSPVGQPVVRNRGVLPSVLEEEMV
jgi:hypothetical protein